MNTSPILRDARLRMPAFIAAVVDRGVRRLAFRSSLVAETARSSVSRAAGGALYKMRRPIERSFLASIDEAFANPDSDSIAGTVDIFLDDGLASRLDLAHVHDAAELACTAERVEFEALYCGAAGGWVVQGANPLRPEVVARCFAAALEAPGVRPSIRNVWFMHLGEPLGAELAQLYRSLSRAMRQRGTREAVFVPPVVAGRRFEPWIAT